MSDFVFACLGCALVIQADEDNSGALNFYEFLEIYGLVKEVIYAAREREHEEKQKAAQQEQDKKADGGDDPDAGLSDEDRARALEMFAGVATAGEGSEEKDIDLDVFKSLITDLMKESNEAAKKSGGKAAPLPKDKDLVAAFKQADVDKSGAVDETEFLELYNQVKAGKVKGLGGGFFSMFSSSLKKKAPEKEEEDEAPEEIDPELMALLDEGEVEALKASFKAGKPVAAKKGDGKERLGKKEFSALLKARAKALKVPLPKDKDVASAFSLADPKLKRGVTEAGFVRFGALVKKGQVAGIESATVFPPKEVPFVDQDEAARVETLKGLKVSCYAEDPALTFVESSEDMVRRLQRLITGDTCLLYHRIVLFS